MKKPLIGSGESASAVALFRRLRIATKKKGYLLISDTSRHGLRPVLRRIGAIKSEVDYTTKQSWRAWQAAAQTAGWSSYTISNYVPYVARAYHPLLSGRLGRYTICDRYFLVMTNGQEPENGAQLLADART